MSNSEGFAGKMITLQVTRRYRDFGSRFAVVRRYLERLSQARRGPLIEVLKQRSFVLDVVCGDGSTLIRISRDITVGIGIDIDREKIIRANDKVRIRHISNIAFHVADARNLPFRRNVFDACVMIDVLHHLSDYYLMTVNLP